jgi:hypothetical protein
MNMGEYTGGSPSNNDLWHEAGYLYFRYSGATEQVLTNRSNTVRLGASATDLQVNGLTTLRIGTVASAENYMTFFPAALGNQPALVAQGNGTTIDIELRPKGSGGRVWIGPWTSNADASINGYILVKSSDGTTKKLATIA